MKKIIIPVDLTPVALHAARYALHHFGDGGSEFIFFHAGDKSSDELKAAISSEATGQIREDNSRFISAEKDFNAALVNLLVEQEQADLVVMGTHGALTPITPDLFGTHTAAVLQECSVPILAVPSGGILKGIRKIVYASDLVKLREELEQVIMFAKPWKAAIDVVHVVPVYPDFFDTEKLDVNGILEEFRAKQDTGAIRFIKEETSFSNQIVTGINKFLDDNEADLLVLFHAERSWIDKILDPSSTVKEVTHIKIPVLVFPKYRDKK